MKKSNILFVLVCLSSFCSNAQETKKVPKDSLPTYTIANCVNEFNIEQTTKTAVGYQYWFADKDFLEGRTLKLSVVGPQQSTHPPHSHVEDEFFFVIEGTAEFYLDGQTAISGPLTSFYCPPHSEHGIRNVGDTELKYLVIKKYNKN